VCQTSKLTLLVQRLVVGLEPPGDSCRPKKQQRVWCLTMMVDPPSHRYENSGLLEYVHLAVRVVSPDGVCSVDGSKVLHAWRYVSPARQFYYNSIGVSIWTCMIYKVLVMLQRWVAGVPLVELGTYPLS